MEDEEQQEVRPPIQVSEASFDASLRRLAELDQMVEETKAELKDLNGQLEQLSWSIANYMLQTGCEKKVLDGITFTQKQRVYPKVEDKEALRKWIEENGAVDLLMRVHPSCLKGYVKECMENEVEIPDGVVPGYIQYYTHVKG
jgi:hypothetical protein